MSVRPVSRVRDDTFRVQIKLVFDPVQHRTHRPYFGLPYRSSCLNINDDSMVCIDQVIGGISEERWAFAGCCLLSAGDVYITERHWLAGSECDVNLGSTSEAAPKAASSNTSRYSVTARGASAGLIVL